ncbi:30S ribosomal protein S1 [Fervidicola ferrireducens]|uniref:30S ribosomal protein S1 n=1 Tax=Fervidicola ferrireducens TaxID=520764 RepID=A0A140L2Y0_9FIRM|nr:hypothetical protein [Fervidicola ferrireducens]KXG74905.1 30S ribosomal protein S1 [Fervidicola ferrireducens]
MGEVFYLDYYRNWKKGVKNNVDVMEYLFQARLTRESIPATIAALDFMVDGPTWILSFPNLDGVKGLVPASEAGVDARVMSRLVGQKLKVKVKGIDRANKLAACSVREVFEEAAQKLKTGDILEGTVLTTAPGGTLLVIADDALVEIPKEKARKFLSLPVYQQYSPGQQVEVRIVSVDEGKATGEVVLPDPWEHADYKRGQFVSAIVYKIKDGIVWLEPELTPGLLGIAPVPVKGSLERGDRVIAVVATFDPSAKKLRFRIVRRVS